MGILDIFDPRTLFSGRSLSRACINLIGPVKYRCTMVDRVVVSPHAARRMPRACLARGWQVPAWCIAVRTAYLPDGRASLAVGVIEAIGGWGQ